MRCTLLSDRDPIKSTEIELVGLDACRLSKDVDYTQAKKKSSSNEKGSYSACEASFLLLWNAERRHVREEEPVTQKVQILCGIFTVCWGNWGLVLVNSFSRPAYDSYITRAILNFVNSSWHEPVRYQHQCTFPVVFILDSTLKQSRKDLVYSYTLVFHHWFELQVQWGRSRLCNAVATEPQLHTGWLPQFR